MSEWDDRRHWARSTAERVIKTQQLDETPVNPQDVAERLGLRVEFTTELDQHVSGKLTYRSGEPIILVNGRDSRRRKRFTIAHEIGHYLDGAEEDVAQYRWGLPMCGTEVFAEEARRQALRVALMDRETDEQEFIGTLWTGAPQRGDPPLRCGVGADHTHPTGKPLPERGSLSPARPSARQWRISAWTRPSWRHWRWHG